MHHVFGVLTCTKNHPVKNIELKGSFYEVESLIVPKLEVVISKSKFDNRSKIFWITFYAVFREGIILSHDTMCTNTSKIFKALKLFNHSLILNIREVILPENNNSYRPTVFSIE